MGYKEQEIINTLTELNIQDVVPNEKYIIGKYTNNISIQEFNELIITIENELDVEFVSYLPKSFVMFKRGEQDHYT